MNAREYLEILHVAERLKDTPRHCTTTKRRAGTARTEYNRDVILNACGDYVRRRSKTVQRSQGRSPMKQEARDFSHVWFTMLHLGEQI